MNQSSSNSALEMEHAIGYSGKIARSVQVHPNGEEYICIAGASLIVTSIRDAHQQWFLQGHDDQITCLAVSNKGRQLASGQKGDNADVIIWDYEQRKALFRLSEHDYEIAFVEFSHDDRLLFSCGNAMDKRIFIWDCMNGFIVGSVVQIPEPTTLARWGGFAKDIKGRDTNRYQLATAGNKQVCLWTLDAKTGHFEHEIINTGNMIRDYLCIDFTLDRQSYLILGTSSGDFCVFQMKNKFFSHYVTVGALGVQSIRCIDEKRFWVGSGNGTLAQYTFTGENKIVQVGKTDLGGLINSINGNGRTTVCATDRGQIFEVENETLQKRLHSENHTGGIINVGYPIGVSDRFASASEDGTIRLWDICEYRVLARCQAATVGIPLCVVYRDEVVLSGWQDGKIRMFRSDNGSEIWCIDNAHKGGVFTLCLARNLKFFCSGGGEGDVRVWEMRTRAMVSHLKEHTHRVTNVQLFGDETQLITSSRDRALLQWDLKNEKRISAHIQRMGGINGFDVIPKSTVVISTGQDRKITYWDLTQMNALKQFDTSLDHTKSDECFQITLSHNGKYLATGGSLCALKIWDVRSGHLLAQGAGHSGAINTVQFSPDDKQLVTGGKDGVLILWNLFL